jgi:hypothetical protein
MNNRSTISFAVIMAFVAAIIATLGASSAQAQCNVIEVRNRTGCALTLCTSLIPSNSTCYTIPAFTDTSFSVPVNTPIIGVRDACNIVRLFPPATGCVSDVDLDPNCCALVCKLGCVITATPVLGPCDC